MSTPIHSTQSRQNNPLPSRTYSWSGYLRAQVRIWWRSPLAYVAIGAALFSFITCGLQLAAGSHNWDTACAYLNMWVVAGGPSFAAVTVGMLSRAELRQSLGGILPRGVAGRKLSVGRFAVAFAWTSINHVVVVAVWWAMTIITTPNISMGQTFIWAVKFTSITMMAYSWYIALLVLISFLTPVVGPTVVMLATILLGIQTVESALWPMCPPAWLLRPQLNLIGTHANGISLTGESLPGGAWALPPSLLLAGLLVIGGGPFVYRSLAWAFRRSNTGRRSHLMDAVTDRIHGYSGALVLVLRGGLVPSLIIVTVACTLILVRWRPPEDAAQFFGIFALPLGCAILPTLWIARLRSGIRTVATRPMLPEKLGWRLVVAMDSVVAVVSTGVALGLAAAGYSDTAALIRHFVVWCATGWLLVSLSSVLNEVAGRVGGLAWAIVGTVFGALVGGTVLNTTVGWFVPTAWGSRTEPVEMIVVLVLSLVIGMPMSFIAARWVYRVRRL